MICQRPEMVLVVYRRRAVVIPAHAYSIGKCIRMLRRTRPSLDVKKTTKWTRRRSGVSTQFGMGVASWGRCSNWNPIENYEKRKNAANSCVFAHLQQASQASDVG